MHIDIQIDTGATKPLLPYKVYKVYKAMHWDTLIMKSTRKLKLQTMLLRLQPYDLNATYMPGGKIIPIGGALSRAHLPNVVPDTEPTVVNMINSVAVKHARYKQYQECTADELNELQ